MVYRPAVPMRNALLTGLLVLATVGACTARGSSGGGDPTPDAAPSDTAADATPTPDTPAPDAPVDLPATPDQPTSPDAPPPLDACVASPESSPAACSNGRDDDCDGMTDCRDLGCATYCVDAGNDACTPRGAENTNAACSNGVDDDCDGFIDCGASGTSPDFDCTLNTAVTVCPRDGGAPVDRPPVDGCTPRGAENTNAACSNGVDDDCDGYIDCGASGTLPDFDCTLNTAVTVCPRDGGAPTDVMCTPTVLNEATTATCSDGLDNDCDGYRDCMDRSCSCVGSCAAFRAGCTCGGAESTNGVCTDGVDNDCDGFTDCADFDCSMTPTVTVCPRDAGTG